jgi:heme-degrading monooxygenase HmoA
MVICLFGTRYKPGYDRELETQLDRELLAALRGVEGFVSFHMYTAADDEVLGVIRFDDRESLEAWRNDPTHRAAWPHAPELYESFWIQNAETYREYVWTADRHRTGEDMRRRFHEEPMNIADLRSERTGESEAEA